MFHLDDAGLAEHLVDRAGWRGRSFGPRAPSAPLGGPAGRHDDDRLDQRDAPGDPGELARVADGLEVEADDVGVSSSSQYCSRSLPDTSARFPAETNVDTPTPRRRTAASKATNRGAGLAEEPDPPARRALRQRGVELQAALRGRDDPVAARPDHPHPARARVQHRALPRQPSAPLGEAPRSSTTPCTPWPAQSGPRRAPRRRAQRRPRGPPGRARRPAVRAPAASARPGRDGVHDHRRGPERSSPSTREASRPRASPRVRAGPDHGDRRRGAARHGSRRLGPVLPVRHTASDRSRWARWSNSRRHDAVLDRCHRYPASREDVDHRLFGQHLGDEPRARRAPGAAAARCSSRTEAMPRPWWASSTRNATSASSGLIPSYRATPMIRPDRVPGSPPG